MTWKHIAPHHEWISKQLDVPVTLATIARLLRDDHHVEVSESTVRRCVASTFVQQRLEEKVTVPRGAVTPGLTGDSVDPYLPDDGYLVTPESRTVSMHIGDTILGRGSTVVG